MHQKLKCKLFLLSRTNEPFSRKWLFYLAWNVKWCVRSGSIFCSAFSCPFPGITCVSFSPRLRFSKCMIIGSGRWLLTMKRGLKTIYKKKRIYQFKANFVPVLQLLKQAINKSLKWAILPLIYYMTSGINIQISEILNVLTNRCCTWELGSKVKIVHHTYVIELFEDGTCM